MKHPPVHWCAAAFVKFEPRASTAAAPVAGGPKPSEMFASFAGHILDE
ncbi:TPA: hypothetical protein ACT5B2_003806 [Burkholderia cenocepacia]|nr:hypothetical protein [Burkholderia cenocepacia]MDN7456599.1 hypothetical protein [Burkholderia cenocepacia]